jgi:excisionase family DNA binding protein
MTGPGRSRGSRNQPLPGRWLRAAEAAEILHVSSKTVQRWAKEGKLPYQATLGGHRRYNEAEIRALVHTVRVGEEVAR